MSNNFICDFCNQEVKERVFVSLDSGVYFHTAHFRCSVCEANLSEKPYYKKAKKYFCEDDYHKLFSPCCEVCKGPIKEQYITALGKPFHLEHFYCMKCNSKFIDGQYYKVDNQAFCKNCYSHFAGVCNYCQEFIIEKMVTVCQKNFHKECLHCEKCGKNEFSDDLYYQKNDKIYHEKCYKDIFYEKCSLCKSFCEIEYTSIEGKPFHNECLELYKEYAKKLIDEELAENEEEKVKEIHPQKLNEREIPPQKLNENEILPQKLNEREIVPQKPNEKEIVPQKLNEDHPEDNITITKTIPIIEENFINDDNNLKKVNSFRSSIKKKDQIKFIHQNVIFQIEPTAINEENNENENNNDAIQDVKTSNKNLTPFIEKKIRSSIRILENEIKSIDVVHKKKSAIFGKKSILKLQNLKKDDRISTFTYDELINNPPKEIDLLKKESYLCEEEFESLFKMKKSQFYSMPKWRQIHLKKKNGLF